MAGLANAELFVEWKTGTPMCLADTTNSDFQGAGTSSAKGLVPDPGNSGTTNRYLNETGVWMQISASQISGLNSGGSPVAVPIINGYFNVSVSSSAATIFVLNASGSIPTSASPVQLVFKNNTANNGAYSVYTLDTSINGTIPSGATLGVTASQGFRVWVTAVTSATSAPALGVIVCKSNINIYPLQLIAQSTVPSTLLTSGSDSSQVIYTASASISNGIANILGYMTWENGLITPGEWSVAPTDVMQSRVGMAFPGDCINQFGTQTGAPAGGNPSIPFDNTIPQITEGTEFITAAGVFMSRANLAEIQSQGFFAVNSSVAAGGGQVTMAIFQDTTTNALATGGTIQDLGANPPTGVEITFWVNAGVAKNTTTTFRMRAGTGISATASHFSIGINCKVAATSSASASAFFGGTYNSYLRVREFMV